MRPLLVLLLASASLVGCGAPGAAGPAPLALAGRPADASPRVLAVVAHPDDETAFAATLYGAARVLGGACDVVVVTNGEGGFKYSTFAEPLYGAELTREEVGRARLPAIRREEMRRGCELLGVRELAFLDQPDHRYTTDEREVLAADAGVWDLDLVRGRLDRRLRRGRYEFVLVLLPTDGTHGHHKAATILALEAVAALPPERRPTVLGATVLDEGEALDYPTGGLDGWPVTSARTGLPAFELDRTRPLGYQGRLDWRVVVNWVIAEHKSQGTMQLAMGRGAREAFVLFDVSPPGAEQQAAALFALLDRDPFPRRTYGPSAGTNTGAGR